MSAFTIDERGRRVPYTEAKPDTSEAVAQLATRVQDYLRLRDELQDVAVEVAVLAHEAGTPCPISLADLRLPLTRGELEAHRQASRKLLGFDPLPEPIGEATLRPRVEAAIKARHDERQRAAAEAAAAGAGA